MSDAVKRFAMVLLQPRSVVRPYLIRMAWTVWQARCRSHCYWKQNEFILPRIRRCVNSEPSCCMTGTTQLLVRKIHSSFPVLSKRGKKERVKDSVQTEVDAILSTQQAARIASFAVQLLDEKGEDLGVMKKSVAETRAKDNNLRLVCIDESKRPNVYQLMTGADLVKFSKEQKLEKKANRDIVKELKTIRLNMGIGERDLEMKLAQVDVWIGKGHGVQISVKSAHKLSQDDVIKNQTNLMEKFTQRFEENAQVKQAFRSDTDLKVKLVPKPSKEDGKNLKKSAEVS